MSERETDKTLALISGPSNKTLISELQAEGRSVILFPGLLTERVHPGRDAAGLIDNLTRFDWLILPDLFAADYFIETLLESGVDLFELDGVRICAAGEAVSDRLRFRQIHADVIPARTEDEVVASAIRDYAGGDLHGMRFLIPAELDRERTLVGHLTGAGAVVTVLPVYRAEFARQDSRVRLSALLKGGAVDEFVFSSPADLLALEFLFGEDLRELLNGIDVSARDDTTFQALQERGLRPRFFRHK